VELEGSQREDDEGGAAWCDTRRTKAGSHGSLRITKAGSHDCTLGIMGHASLIEPHQHPLQYGLMKERGWRKTWPCSRLGVNCHHLSEHDVQRAGVAHPEKNSLHPGCKLQVRILSHILKLVPLSYNKICEF
jgi:hypothetical protein